jgi:hypothetical protein
LWPGTQLLGHFLSHEYGRSLLANRVALELGRSSIDYHLAFSYHHSPSDCLLGADHLSSMIVSGAGVAGLCAYGICQRLVLSDHNDIVIRLLRRNAEHAVTINNSNATITASTTISSSMSSSTLSSEHKQSPSPLILDLNWGDALPSELSKNMPSVILGSDIVYSSAAAAELLRTVYQLLTRSNEAPARASVPSVMVTTINIPFMNHDDIIQLSNSSEPYWILSYVSRWHEVDRAFHSWVVHHSLLCKVI